MHHLKLNRRSLTNWISAAFAAVAISACGGGGGENSSGSGSAAGEPSTTPPAAAAPQFQLATWLAPQNDMLETGGIPNLAPAFPEFKEQTLRQTAHVSVGGDQL